MSFACRACWPQCSKLLLEGRLEILELFARQMVDPGRSPATASGGIAAAKGLGGNGRLYGHAQGHQVPAAGLSRNHGEGVAGVCLGQGIGQCAARPPRPSRVGQLEYDRTGRCSGRWASSMSSLKPSASRRKVVELAANRRGFSVTRRSPPTARSAAPAARRSC